MSTLSALQILDQLNKFHKTWYEQYAIEQHPNVIIFYFLVNKYVDAWNRR
jgi:hypothetical protein